MIKGNGFVMVPPAKKVVYLIAACWTAKNLLNGPVGQGGMPIGGRNRKN